MRPEEKQHERNKAYQSRRFGVQDFSSPVADGSFRKIASEPQPGKQGAIEQQRERMNDDQPGGEPQSPAVEPPAAACAQPPVRRGGEQRRAKTDLEIQKASQQCQRTPEKKENKLPGMKAGVY